MKSGHLDGEWTPTVSKHAYEEFTNGDVTVRFDDGFEPDGELVTTAPVTVHLERMDTGLWSLILTDIHGTATHVDLYSKSAIGVLWRAWPAHIQHGGTDDDRPHPSHR